MARQIRARKIALDPVAPKGIDTRERILLAAEDLLRKHGPAKTTVVDVARALGMSHANVYRHFASKAELHDAVAQRWLTKISKPLDAIVRGPGTAGVKLERWVLALNAAKRMKVLDDPELFATYHAIVQAVRQVVDEHLAELHAQVRTILAEGVARGEFKVKDLDAATSSIIRST
jgi:AcrR family transcriptional regulator